MNNFYLRFNHDIWNVDEMSIEKKLILNFIWNFCVKSGASYASPQYIAECFNLNVDTVSKLIKELLEENHIIILEKNPRVLMSVNLSRYPIE